MESLSTRRAKTLMGKVIQNIYRTTCDFVKYVEGKDFEKLCLLILVRSSGILDNWDVRENVCRKV